MKKAITLLILFLTLLNAFAQTPQKISYQCVVRNASGGLVVNQGIGVKISIIHGTISGPVVYQELFNPNPVTNGNGLLTLEIGTGIPVSGAFSSVNWSGGPFFIKTEIDPTGATSYTITGTSQILSVPYAFLSKSTESIPDNIVTTPKIAGNAVTIANLPAGATGSTYLRGDGTWQVPSGTSSPGGASGNIQYNGSGSFAGSGNLHWDYTNLRLGIGTNTPDSRVQIKAGSTMTYPQLKLTETSTGYSRINFQNSTGTAYWAIAAMNSATNENERFNIYNSVSGDAISISGTGNVSIGTEPSSNKRLYVWEPGDGYTGYFASKSYNETLHVENSGTGAGARIISNSSTETLHVRNSGTGFAAIFDGDLLLYNDDSEINIGRTMRSNIAPFCYGSVEASGTKNSGGSTSNFKVIKIAQGVYDIDINETYSQSTHTAIASIGDTGFLSTNAIGGKLRVYTYNLSGVATDREFSFVIFKP